MREDARVEAAHLGHRSGPGYDGQGEGANGQRDAVVRSGLLLERAEQAREGGALALERCPGVRRWRYRPA